MFAAMLIAWVAAECFASHHPVRAAIAAVWAIHCATQRDSDQT
jgi:hypothetical protein